MGVDFETGRAETPRALLLAIRQAAATRCFVETGTHLGGTAAWAAHHFDRVVTIEKSEALYTQAKSQQKEAPNLEFHLGDSRALLARLVPELGPSVLFWLDSHWSGAETSGADDECPLMAELAVVNSSLPESPVVVDDARLFTSPPPLPHEPAQWPELAQVLSAVSGPLGRYVVIVDDCIVAVPMRMKPWLVAYCQERNTEQWRRFLRSREASAPLGIWANVRRLLGNR